MATLILEKRGCNFFKGSEEAQKSDLENYRLFGWISINECVEICTHFRAQQKAVNSYVDYSFFDKEGILHTNLEKTGYSSVPTKEQVLNFINKTFNKNFQKIQIVDKL